MDGDAWCLHVQTAWEGRKSRAGRSILPSVSRTSLFLLRSYLVRVRGSKQADYVKTAIILAREGVRVVFYFVLSHLSVSRLSFFLPPSVSKPGG